MESYLMNHIHSVEVKLTKISNATHLVMCDTFWNINGMVFPKMKIC